MDSERVILHSDMNSFYASVEMMLDPELKGKPVAVCGSTEERHGIVLAKSDLAKKAGVKTGMVNWEARQLCPGLIVVPPQYDQYLKYSKLARQIYHRYTDLVEPYGMDECWLDVSGSIRGTGEQIGNEIRQRMKDELGLTISVGVSFNKVFAKLGSDMKKPDALTMIPKETFREIVWDLPASDLLGVGRATEEVLANYGIRTIGALANASEDLIRRKLGKCGVACIRFAQGLDNSRVMEYDYESPVKSVGHGLTTKADLENSAEVWALMLALSQDIGHKLRKYDKRAGGVQIDIRNNQLKTKQWQCKLSPHTNSAAIIAKAAYTLFEKSYSWDYPIRSVTVRAIDLYAASAPEQLDMFGNVSVVDKKERLESVVEEIHRRFDKNSILPATISRSLPKLPTDREVEIRMPTGMLS